jgi:hypothetical protein
VQKVQLHRDPTKRGPPQIKGPMQRQTLTRGLPDKRVSTHWVRGPLSGGPLEWDPLSMSPLSKGSFELGPS